ncbi:phosphoenolpyruvate-protein phosphotransferase [Megasphaera cerevisiae DSM 20462]|uniref:Phosphoenolpyruvate-protein phosphotransferase n=1 Tax=Megasphaera cerevisiae DSM 20462 TaxID=1122219 RepID=A0A0J6ZS39_9FIRM|nr:phosphoenolpyruvate--protein phosphotransferase [Megasphaera cerevisiae]KMO87776.1 phosphoenolpyruvate-protein phosphotransferase [Megasphaera cerevisiae DSM 20462]SJZ62901.1 phosphoenolpyruvate--protein phosphotransferase [Megasphaera cerevisiae DSM 20462]
MLTLKGKSVFAGITIGPLALFHRNTISTASHTVENPEVEVIRFQKARDESIEQLKGLYDKAVQKVGEEQAAVFEVHQMMLEDDDYVDSVEEKIRNGKINAEAAVDQTAQELADMFRHMEDAYMQARAADVLDISRRVEQQLCGGAGIDFSKYDHVIIAADDLAPSETLQLDTDRILGFVTSSGSTNSHTAILARTLGIAAVVNTGNQLHNDVDGLMAIIDGLTGMVYIDPDEDTLSQMRIKQQEEKACKARLEQVRHVPTVTRDGRVIKLFANIGNPGNLPQVLANDAEGIGLFRSEFLYLENSDYPTEEQQFEAYKKTLEVLEGKTAVIRTLDIGADKQVDYFDLAPEVNPAMGMRAIRICLTRPDLFKTQLRALCRASAFGKLAIMFPMIISVAEVRKAKKILEEVQIELDEKAIAYDKDMEVGIMVETPASAVMSDELAKEVDFFSIGSNDLTQYTLAIDRQQTALDAFFDSHHPAVLRLIQQTIENGHKAGIWVGICGELGADLTLTETFLRMGVDELSVSPPAVLPLREKIRSLDLNKA